MSFDWRSYQALAQHLVGLPEAYEGCSDETIHRVAISRSYYAIFHLAVNYVESLPGGPLSRYRKHEEVITRMDGLAKAARGVPDHIKNHRQTIADKLLLMREARKAADYEAVLQEPSRRIADRTLKYAERCLRAFEALSQP